MMQSIHAGIYDTAYTPDQGDGKGALLVVGYRDKGGTMLRGAVAAEWAEHIQTALDAREADALCRAVYRAD